MLSVGLTGGIGSGKSTVSRLLASYGAVVVDADLLAREVLAPGTPGLAAVEEAFGSGLVEPDGGLDRAALGAIVFGDPGELARLNAIVHPLVAARTADRVAQAKADGAPVLVHDVALLVENGLADAYDEVVVVAAAPEARLDRLVRLRGLAEADARARMAAQASDAERLAVATHVLNNDGTPEALEVQVRALWRVLRAATGEPRGEGHLVPRT